MKTITVAGNTYRTMQFGTITEVMMGDYTLMVASDHTSLMEDVDGDACSVASTDPMTVEDAVVWAGAQID